MVSSASTASNQFPTTAFGDLRTAELTPQFQGSFEYTVDNTELNTNTLVAGGTITQSGGMAVCSTSTTTASSAKFESKRHAKYRPGLGGVMRFTALFSAPEAATDQYIGLMDTEGSSSAFKNGYCIGYDGTSFGLHRFSNDVKTSVAQSSWDDPMDGTGDSGMTLDQAKLNVFFIQFQYLGAGAIVLWLESQESGELVKAHTIKYANSNTGPSVINPNFHFMICANNKATTTDLIIKSASYGYFIEGLTKYFELHQPQFSSGEQELTGVTTEEAVLTIRNKTSYSSKDNFIDILIENVTGSIEASSANNLGKIRLVRNATLGGTPSYSDIDSTDSVVDMDTSGTTVTGGKEILSSPFAGKNDRFGLNTINYDIILAPGETLTVAASSSNNATVDASMLWKELF